MDSLTGVASAPPTDRDLTAVGSATLSTSEPAAAPGTSDSRLEPPPPPAESAAQRVGSSFLTSSGTQKSATVKPHAAPPQNNPQRSRTPTREVGASASSARAHAAPQAVNEAP